MKLRVGTRGSALARAQTQQWMRELQQAHPELSLVEKNIVTTGDRVQDRFLSEVGGKGLFVKEIEQALLRGEIDLAVHSAKDVPSHLDPEFQLACYPKRASVHDVLISRERLARWEDLPQGAVVGTTSLRRRLQLQAKRPDLRFALLRGNIDTRLQKLSRGEFDAIVLAEAGLGRLGKSPEHCLPLSMVPAPGQGALAIEILRSREDVATWIKALDDAETRFGVEIERGIAQGLNGDCNLPVGLAASRVGEEVFVRVFLSNLDLSRVIEMEKNFREKNGEAIVEAVMEELWRRGAREILRELRG